MTLISITIFLDRKIGKKPVERFNLLSEERDMDVKQNKLSILIGKYRKYISGSVVISFFINILSGLWKSTSYMGKDYFGFPLQWMIQDSNKNIPVEYDLYFLLGNWLIYAIIVFIILMVCVKIKQRRKKPRGVKKIPTHGSNEKIWEKDPSFFREK